MATSSLERIAEGSIRTSLTRKLLPLLAGTSFLAVHMTSTLSYYLTARLLDPEKVRIYRHWAALTNLVPWLLCGLLLAALIVAFRVIMRFYAEPLIRTTAWAASCIRDGVLHPYKESTPVAEVRELAEHIGHLVGELHERVGELRDLPHDMRHCLVTYATRISLQAQLLEADAITKEEAVEYIVSTTETMREILNLEVTITENYSRIGGAKPEPVDLIEIVRDCARHLDSRMKEREIVLTMRMPDTCVRLAHRQKIASIVHNLLDNAIKYNRAGGRIEVRLESDENGIVLTISDTGIGIPVDEQSDIFRRGRRGAAATSSGIEGTGHGLALVRSLVKFYLGDITCTSKPGEGTTFTVTLPIKKGNNT